MLRFSPIVRATPAICWQPVDGGNVERLMKPQHGESHAPESWSSEGRPASVQHHKGIRRVVMDVFDAGQKGDAVRRRSLVAIPPVRVFAGWTMGGVYQYGNAGEETIYVEPFPSTGDKASASRRKRPAFPMRWAGHQTEGNCFTCREFGGFEAVAITTEPRFGFGIPWRCRDHPSLFRASQHREPLRRHTKGGVRGSYLHRDDGRGNAPNSPNPGRPQLVRRVKARVPPS